MPEQRIDWVSGTPRDAVTEYLDWRAAVESADNGDNKPLARLLRSDRMPGPEARELIADLLDRHRLRRPRGGQATPAYLRTRAEAHLDDGAALFRYFRQKGVSEADALQEALRAQKREQLALADGVNAYSVDAYSDEQIDALISEGEQQKLANRVAGRRGSTRRINKRARA